MRASICIAGIVALTACSPAKDSPPANAATASVSELGQMNRDFAAAINAKDAAKAASYYTEDAILIPPGEPIVRGRAAIEAYWKGAIEQGGVRDASVETIDAANSGDSGYEIGTFTLTVNGPNGQPVQDKGRYVELLKRGADGVWYATLGMWNAAEPSPADR